MLKILDRPQAEPIGVALLKNHLRLTHDLDDDRLMLLLVSARETLEKTLGQAFLTQKLMFVFRPSLYRNRGLICEKYPYRLTPGSIAIRLPMGPFRRLEEVRIKTQEGDYHSLDLKAKTDVHPDGHTLMIHVPWHPEVQVVYEAGYGSTPDEVPAPLKTAILRLAAALYEENEGGFWSSLDSQNLLSPFRRWRIA